MVTRVRRAAIEHLSDMKKKFGITTEQYARLYPPGVQCEICGVSESVLAGQKARLVIDHDHKSGRIRGVICNSCNLALGWAVDSPELLRAMADYLEDFEKFGGPLDNG